MMTISTDTYSNSQLPMPEWIRSERYEYCDNFWMQEKHFDFGSWTRSIRKFFKR